MSAGLPYVCTCCNGSGKAVIRSFPNIRFTRHCQVCNGAGGFIRPPVGTDVAVISCNQHHLQEITTS